MHARVNTAEAFVAAEPNSPAYYSLTLVSGTSWPIHAPALTISCPAVNRAPDAITTSTPPEPPLSVVVEEGTAVGPADAGPSGRHETTRSPLMSVAPCRTARSQCACGAGGRRQEAERFGRMWREAEG